MRFSEIKGLTDVKQQLITSVLKNKIAHAHIFSGEEGSANMSLSLAFISFILCENKNDTDSCGKCNACYKTDRLIHPDIRFSFPIYKITGTTGEENSSQSFLEQWRKYILNYSPSKTFISVNNKNIYGGLQDWAKFLKEESKPFQIFRSDSSFIIQSLTLKPSESNYNIIFQWLPEELHSSGANALLKIIEEPPPNCLFIFVSHNYEKIMNTIKSRCRYIKIPPFTQTDIENYTTEYFPNNQKIKEIALLSHGNLNKAWKLLEMEEENFFDFLQKWMRACWSKDINNLLSLTEGFAQKTKISQKNTIQYTLHIIRESAIKHFHIDTTSQTEEEQKTFVTNFSKALTTENMQNITKLCDKLIDYIDRNANIKLSFFNISLLIASELKNKTN
ncbi:MAG: hypothetical protein QM536_05695 [Chitinophagaceae bacterium]|nr:hypothetical protein [Chitinophagaceae bacterium]